MNEIFEEIKRDMDEFFTEIDKAIGRDPEEEEYDHSLDIIDPDEPEIPGPDIDSYGYNDQTEADYLEMKAELHHGI